MPEQVQGETAWNWSQDQELELATRVTAKNRVDGAAGLAKVSSAN
jgi:hypothetical protein